MEEWTVVGVLVVLIGLIATIAKPMINLNTTLTKLIVQVEKLEQSMRETAEKSDRSVAKLWKHNDKQDETLADHEVRLSTIEQLNK